MLVALEISGALHDFTVEADAGHQEEVAAVGDTEIDPDDSGVGDGAGRLRGVERHGELARPDVDGAEGEVAQRSFGTGEGLYYFVDSAVAAGGQDNVGSSGDGLARQIGSMTREL